MNKILIIAIISLCGLSVKAQNIEKYVDLALPSGTLWAICNVGASSPEEYGDYFAWGETFSKSNYNWSTYKYCDGASDIMTKYCVFGNGRTIDNKIVLESIDDAATVNWGSPWRMPTEDDFDELFKHTDTKWTTLNGVSGQLIISKKNGSSIFMPAAGSRFKDSLDDADTIGYYWSSSLDNQYKTNTNAYSIRCDKNGNTSNRRIVRACGLSIRPVRMK